MMPCLSMGVVTLAHNVAASNVCHPARDSHPWGCPGGWLCLVQSEEHVWWYWPVYQSCTSVHPCTGDSSLQTCCYIVLLILEFLDYEKNSCPDFSPIWLHTLSLKSLSLHFTKMKFLVHGKLIGNFAGRIAVSPVPSPPFWHILSFLACLWPLLLAHSCYVFFLTPSLLTLWIHSIINLLCTTRLTSFHLPETVWMWNGGS